MAFWNAIDWPIEQMRHWYEIDGLTCAEIAKRLDKNPKLIQQVCKKNSFLMRKRGGIYRDHSSWIGRQIGYLEVMEYTQERTLKCKCLNCERITFQQICSLDKKQRCQNCFNKPKGLGGLHRLFRHYKRSATARKLSFDLTLEQFEKITSSNCSYCGKPPSIWEHNHCSEKSQNKWSSYCYNGIDRKNNDLGYAKENSASCCKTCNYAKRDMSYAQFIDFLNHLVSYRLSIGNLTPQE